MAARADLVYGSVARGTSEPESDVDVLVLTDQPLDRAEEDAVMDAVFDLELERRTVISTLCYARSDWARPIRQVSPFYREVEQDGVIL